MRKGSTLTDRQSCTRGCGSKQRQTYQPLWFLSVRGSRHGCFFVLHLICGYSCGEAELSTDCDSINRRMTNWIWCYIAKIDWQELIWYCSSHQDLSSCFVKSQRVSHHNEQRTCIWKRLMIGLCTLLQNTRVAQRLTGVPPQKRSVVPTYRWLFLNRDILQVDTIGHDRMLKEQYSSFWKSSASSLLQGAANPNSHVVQVQVLFFC